MRHEWRGVVIHNTGGQDKKGDDFASIKAWHTTPEPNGRGWHDIGYHFVVEQVGGLYRVTVGRPMNQDGAHVKNYNDRFLGVALVGNFNLAEPPEAQLSCAAKFVAALLDQHGIDRSKVYPHSAFNPTDCPGTRFPMARFAAMVTVA